MLATFFDTLFFPPKVIFGFCDQETDFFPKKTRFLCILFS